MFFVFVVVVVVIFVFVGCSGGGMFLLFEGSGVEGLDVFNIGNFFDVMFWDLFFVDIGFDGFYLFVVYDVLIVFDVDGILILLFVMEWIVVDDDFSIDFDFCIDVVFSDGILVDVDVVVVSFEYFKVGVCFGEVYVNVFGFVKVDDDIVCIMFM